MTGPPYVLYADCLSNCSVHSEGCTEYGFGWICNCWDDWAWNDNCLSTKYQFTPAPLYNFMWIAGILATLPGTILILFDMILHARSKDVLTNVSFFTKIACFVFGFFRLYYFIEVGVTVSTQHAPTAPAHRTISQIFFWIPVLDGVLCLCLCTVAWLNLALSLKAMTTSQTSAYTRARNIFIFVTATFTIVGSLLVVLLATRSNVIFLLLAGWLALTGFPTSIYCLVHVYKLRLTLLTIEKRRLKKVVTRKNFIVGSIALLMDITFITLLLMRALPDLLLTHWIYFTFMIILRVEELSLFYLFIDFCASHLRKFIHNRSTTSTTLNSASAKSVKGSVMMEVTSSP